MRRACLLAVVLLPACGSTDPVDTDPRDTDVDTDTVDPFEPGPDLPAGTAAAFALVTDQVREDIVWQASEDHLVFCRVYGTEAWIRLAEQLAADGENGPHIDIDVCGWDTSAAGTWSASTEGCGTGQTFDISWHDGSAQVYANDPASTDCTLQLTPAGERIEGRFECRNMAVLGEGEAAVDIRNGQFRCTPEDG